jgi:hypothetical protein
MIRVRLTPLLRGQIVAGIRSGGFVQVAAEAWGVPKDVLDDWLRRGTGKGARDPYAAFAGDVRMAQAQARLRAELLVFQDEPKVWLEHGPGRETPDRPGWTTAARPAERGRDDDALGPEALRLMGSLVEWLQPYPDARATIATKVQETRRQLAA